MRFLLAIALLQFTLSAQAPPPLRIVLVGDSTVNDQGGWGPGFKDALSS